MKPKLFLLCVLVPFALVACAAPAPTATTVPPTATAIPPTPVPPTATPKPNNRVLLIAKADAFAMELMLVQEVGVMISMLKNAGFEVVVASPTGKLIRGDPTTLQPDMKLADVIVEDYIGLIIPCMAIESHQPEAIEIAKKAAVLGKPIAAQNGSVLVLGSAGLLKGKQYAFHPGYEQYVPEGIYKGAGVVQDGNLLTSGSCPYTATTLKPDTTTELTQKFIDLLKSVR